MAFRIVEKHEPEIEAQEQAKRIWMGIVARRLKKPAKNRSELGKEHSQCLVKRP